MNVGSVFNRNAPLESDKLATTKSRIHAAIPGAVNDLNDALDTLEGDLVSATPGHLAIRPITYIMSRCMQEQS